MCLCVCAERKETLSTNPPRFLPLQCSNQQTSMLVWGVDLLKAYAPPSQLGLFSFRFLSCTDGQTDFCFRAVFGQARTEPKPNRTSRNVRLTCKRDLPWVPLALGLSTSLNQQPHSTTLKIIKLCSFRCGFGIYRFQAPGQVQRSSRLEGSLE